MKKIIIPMLVLTAWATSLSAQITREQTDMIVLEHPQNEVTPPQIFSKTSSWSEITTNLFDSTFVEITTYKLDGDTLIEGKSYSKLFKDDEFCVALRETEDHEIYVYFPGLDRELLIYDFDWYPGKTLYFQPEYMEEPIVQTVLGESIDSVQLLDGKYYQYIDIGTFEYGTLSIIRGIGYTDGFFRAIFEAPSNGDQYALLCFYIDDTLVYSNSYFNNCFVEITEIINVPTTTIAGTPLTLSGTVVPDNATYQNITWSVYDEGTTGATITDGELNTTEQGTVVVTATVNYDMFGTAYTQNFTIEVEPNVSVNEPVQEFSNITLYPNPTSSEMTVVLNNPAVKIVEMELYDLFGKKVQQQTVNQSYGTLNMNELSQGVYILKVRLSQGDVVMRKVVRN